jgi:hypothetical protein
MTPPSPRPSSSLAVRVAPTSMAVLWSAVL